jgi:hypothetical protein
MSPQQEEIPSDHQRFGAFVRTLAALKTHYV